MSLPTIGDDERRRLLADAYTPEGLDRTLARLQSILREARRENPEVVGSFQRILTSLDDGLAPDDPVAVQVDRYRRGVLTRAELLAHPEVAERLRARMGGTPT
jgi:hypothetical protein